ncbi:MAG: 4'-phosphopantetheinyl transferase superfamily protein [Cyanobacteria bacterium]|nr:4'-phosphopantetheinyl transferase superfamily protein [Cyanobacteriota bacterium]
MAWGTPKDQEAPALLLLDRRAAAGAETTRALVALLDHGEQERVQRLRRPEDQDRYRLGRAALRQVLGAWLDRDPAALRFRYGPHGKPALDGVVDAAPHFNVAHSGDLILLAFHATCPVGVDVERHRPDLAWEPLARRVLPSVEYQFLEQLPPGQRRDAFLAAWCRLEARLKARGEGLAGLARLQAEAHSGQEPAGERTWEVAMPAGYRAAAAVAASA